MTLEFGSCKMLKLKGHFFLLLERGGAPLFCSDDINRAGLKGIQPGTEGGFQALKLGAEGAVAGKIGGVRGQTPGTGVQKYRVGDFHQVKATDEDVRAEVVGDGDDALVGAAAD